MASTNGEVAIGCYALVYTPTTQTGDNTGSATSYLTLVISTQSKQLPIINYVRSSGTYQYSELIPSITNSKTTTIKYLFSYNILATFDGSNYIITINDTARTAIPGVVVNFIATNCSISATSGTTNSSGQITITVSSILANATVNASTTLLGVVEQQTQTVNSIGTAQQVGIGTNAQVSG